MIRKTLWLTSAMLLPLLLGCPPTELSPPGDDTPGMDLPDEGGGAGEDQPGDMPAEDVPSDDRPADDVPPDSDGPVDGRVDSPAAQFASDDLVDFVLAVDGGALEGEDLRMLTVGAEVLFSLPDVGSLVRQIANVSCTCSWSVTGVGSDGVSTPGTFSSSDECMTVYAVSETGDAIISVTQHCGESVPITLYQGVSALANVAQDDDDTPTGPTDGGTGGGGGVPPDDEDDEPVETAVLSVVVRGDGDVQPTPIGDVVSVDDGVGYRYPVGTDVTLQSVVEDGECFFRWGGDVSSMDETIQVVMDEDRYVLSEFIDENAPPPAPMLDGHVTQTNMMTATISGTVESCASNDVATVEVDSPSGTVTTGVTDTRFSVEVPLASNRTNPIYVTAITDVGVRGPASTTIITQDSQAPTLFIDFPEDNIALTNSAIDVAGRVSDLLSGFMGLDVTVNGAPAIVDVGIGTNGTFERGQVPLAMGENVISASATDALGNVANRSITVTRVAIPPSSPQMVVAGGGGQAGPVHAVLPNPIEVQVNKPSGMPFANKVVTFDVTRSDGRLFEAMPMSAGAGMGSMSLQVRTDANGRARAFWQMGSDAGCGNNRVTVRSTSIAGTTFFCASATPAPPAQLNIGTGNFQRVETNSPAPEPLRVWVNDQCNGVPGIPVTFSVVRNNGLVNDRSSITVMTSDTGHAEVDFVAGSEQGNNLIDVDFATNPTGPARFVIFGVERITNSFEGTPTSFSGLVLNNNDQPIEGTEIQLIVGGKGYFTTSDANGMFKYDDLPTSGPADLYINGSAATRVGGVDIGDQDGQLNVTFPSLHFEPVIVPKTENTLAGPVLLPSLNPANVQTFDNTEDVTLTVEGIEGLSMLIRAGSMTLADGSVPDAGNPTTVALNQVHFDRIPMPMPDGAAPPFAWTLQPSGATFNPPVEITYPNMSGLPAGAVAYFLSFNHDTMRFEIVATGTVTGDGSQIKTDPGAGLRTAGWGCNCPPYSVTSDCANCSIELQDSETRYVQINDTVLFNADGEPDPGSMSWNAPDGIPSGGNGSVFVTKYDMPGMYQVTATYTPDGEEAESCEFTIDVVVVEAEFVEHPNHFHGWDDRTDAAKPKKSIKVNDSDVVQANLGADTDDVFFISGDESFVSVLPEVSSVEMETVFLTGEAVGTAVVEARAGATNGPTVAEVEVSAYDELSKTVAVILINEENDDVQVAAVGQVVGPGGICVSAGANNFIDSDVNDGPSGADPGDDTIVGMDVTAGANGVCETFANNFTIPGTDVDDATLINYMNNVAYNQAVISWTVTRLAAVDVNFDLDRDGQINVDTNFLANAEMQAVRDTAGDTSYDYNVFLVDGASDGSFGFAGFNQRYTFVHGDSHTGSTQTMSNTIAHEVGHALGMCHPDFASCINDPDTKNLMHSVATNPTRLRKAQWDQLNP